MSDRKERASMPQWMRTTLLLAGLYNLAWGLSVVVFPGLWFEFFSMAPPRYPQIWQCVGMIVGLYGVAYWIAARDPIRHWPIVLVGLLGKFLGPIGFVQAAWDGALPWAWGVMIVTNDLVWWLPFAAILYTAWRQGSDTGQAVAPLAWERALTECRSHRGASLLELSRDAPTLVVFLRHSGCTFCRVALHELGRLRAELAAARVQLAIVHMSDPMAATLWCEKYDLGDVHRFSDRHCQLYRAFGLDRATLRQTFGLRLWWRGVCAAVWQGHGIGWQDGDGFRLSGAFLLSDGKLLAAERSATPADVPDFLGLARVAGHSRHDLAQRRTEQPAVKLSL